MADESSRAGNSYGTESILEFVHKVHSGHDKFLQRAFDAPAVYNMPPIQVSPSEGKLLGLLIGLSGAKKIVEVGTLAGYSALWIARHIPPDGHIWTIELEPKHVDVAQSTLKAAGVADRVTILEGLALGILEILVKHGPFDAVFIDADKGNYDHYGRWAAKNLRVGGLLMADNAFYFKGLLDDTPEAAAMRRFHQETAQAFDSVCIPTPDGMVLGVLKPR